MLLIKLDGDFINLMVMQNLFCSNTLISKENVQFYVISVLFDKNNQINGKIQFRYFFQNTLQLRGFMQFNQNWAASLSDRWRETGRP